MKKSIIKTAILFATVLILSCCVRYEPLGKCSNPPRFSTRTLDFDASGGTGIITSNARYWNIQAIAIDGCQWETPHGTYLSWLPLGCGEIGEGDCWLIVHCDTIYASNDPHQQFPIIRPRGEFEGAWFRVNIEINRQSNKQLVFEIKPNDTGENRRLLIDIFAGNCFLPYLVISQSAE